MVWMFFVERICLKDIFRIHTDSPKKKMPPTQRLKTSSQWAFLIPLVAPYDQFLI